MTTTGREPYAGLTPDAVLDACESLGLACDGRQLTLNSYENRVYQVPLDDGRVVGRGAHATLLADCPTYAQFAESQSMEAS